MAGYTSEYADGEMRKATKSDTGFDKKTGMRTMKQSETTTNKRGTKKKTVSKKDTFHKDDSSRGGVTHSTTKENKRKVKTRSETFSYATGKTSKEKSITRKK